MLVVLIKVFSVYQKYRFVQFGFNELRSSCLAQQYVGMASWRKANSVIVERRRYSTLISYITNKHSPVSYVLTSAALEISRLSTVERIVRLRQP